MSTKIIPPKITNGFLCDSEPTEDSTNLMTSGDIYTAIQSAGGGGGSGVFDIHFTAVWDEQTQSDVVTCDKTLAEIEAASADGLILCASILYGSSIYLASEYCISPAENSRYFGWLYILWNDSLLFYPTISWDDLNNKWVTDFSAKYTLTPAT